MAAVEREGTRRGAVAAEGVEHLAREFGEHGGVVSAVNHEAVAASTHAALDVRHGTNGRPVIAEFVHRNVVAKAFPDVIGGHALADDVSVVGGDVKEAADADGGVVDQGDVTNGGADARAEDTELGVALLLKPAEAAAGIQDRLAVGLKRKADVGAANLVGALVALRHAAIVIGQAHLERSDPEACGPLAEAILAVPFGVPVGKDEDGSALRRLDRRPPTARGGPEPGVNSIVLGPGRLDGTGEGEDVFCVEVIVRGRSGGVPIAAVFNGVLRVLADEGAGCGLVGRAADVLEAPVERLDATVVVGGPAAMLVAADFAFEEVHETSRQLTVYSAPFGKEKQGMAKAHSTNGDAEPETPEQEQELRSFAALRMTEIAPGRHPVVIAEGISTQRTPRAQSRRR